MGEDSVVRQALDLQARAAQAAREDNRSASAAAGVGLRLGGSDDVRSLSR